MRTLIFVVFFSKRFLCGEAFFYRGDERTGQKHDFWTPFGIQLGPKLRPKSAKWRQHVENKLHMVLQKRVPETTIVIMQPLGPTFFF